MSWSFRSLHASLATFPKAPHVNFVRGEKVPPRTRSSVPPQTLGTHRQEASVQRDREKKAFRAPRWTEVGAPEHPFSEAARIPAPLEPVQTAVVG